MSAVSTEARLPGGFERDGSWQRSLWLHPWSGRDEFELFEPAHRRPAALATALLARCVYLEGGNTAVGADFVRDLTVGDREALLLQLRAITLGDALPCVLVCPACGETMELALRTADLLVPEYEWQGRWHEAAFEPGETVAFRAPTGGDQEAVAELADRNPAEAARTIGFRCTRQGDDREEVVADGALAVAGERMAELDPQAEIRIDLDCPECGQPCRTLFDTLSYLQAEVERSRARLLQDIHLLAFYYHWSEADILAMPRAKRIRYIEHLLGALEARRAS